jgi:hypothetical protein
VLGLVGTKVVEHQERVELRDLVVSEDAAKVDSGAFESGTSVVGGFDRTYRRHGWLLSKDAGCRA